MTRMAFIASLSMLFTTAYAGSLSNGLNVPGLSNGLNGPGTGGGSTVPGNALVDRFGSPLLTRDGAYLLTR